MSSTRDGRLLGTVEEAAAICGCGVSTYRSYVSRQQAPKSCGFDPETGLKLFDLDAVRAWHEARPGRGARTDLRDDA